MKIQRISLIKMTAVFLLNQLLFFFSVPAHAAISKELSDEAEKEEAEAQLHLAQKYLDGIDTERDPGRAYYWFRQAARNGDLNAQLKVAQMYFFGEGVAKDNQKSFYFFGG